LSFLSSSSTEGLSRGLSLDYKWGGSSRLPAVLELRVYGVYEVYLVKFFDKIIYLVRFFDKIIYLVSLASYSKYKL